MYAKKLINREKAQFAPAGNQKVEVTAASSQTHSRKEGILSRTAVYFLLKSPSYTKVNETVGAGAEYGKYLCNCI